MTTYIESIHSDSVEYNKNTGFSALFFITGTPHLYGAIKFRKYHRQHHRHKQPTSLFTAVTKAIARSLIDIWR